MVKSTFFSILTQRQPTFAAKLEHNTKNVNTEVSSKFIKDMTMKNLPTITFFRQTNKNTVAGSNLTAATVIPCFPLNVVHPVANYTIASVCASSNTRWMHIHNISA